MHAHQIAASSRVIRKLDPMPRRTTPTDASLVEQADDLEHLVKDKRAIWRADGARARRRQRRYKNLLTRKIVGSGAETDMEDME